MMTSMLPRRPASEEDDSLSPFKISIAVNGIDVDCKFCQTCNMYRPPRSNHCGVCNNCIGALGINVAIFTHTGYRAL